MQNQLSLLEMVETLLKVDDEAWGMYAFSRDILKTRIPEEKKSEMIKKSIVCGQEYAKLLINKYQTSDVRVIAEQLKLNIVYQDALITGKRILFASYNPPNEITIMTEPPTRAVEHIYKEESKFIEYFDKDVIINTILGHEIFHYIEEQFEQEIYTRTEKILLWNFWGFKNYSTLRALGEIAAMAFTKEINNLDYSPFILDILLYYSYNYLNAEKIYRDVLEMN